MVLVHDLARLPVLEYKACLKGSHHLRPSIKRHPDKWKRSLSSTCLVHDFLHKASGDDRSPALARHPNTSVKHLIAAM